MGMFTTVIAFVYLVYMFCSAMLEEIKNISMLY